MTDDKILTFEQAIQMQIECADESIRQQARGKMIPERDIQIMVGSMQAGLRCALETYRKCVGGG